MLYLTSTASNVFPHIAQNLTRSPKETRLTFIPTAAEVEEGSLSWLHEDRDRLTALGFRVTDFTFTGKTSKEVQGMLENSDMLLVAGGNTFFLLQQMQKSGFDTLIAKYVEKGLLYAGSSAGSIVAGPDISLARDADDPSAAPDLKSTKGLGLTDVIVLPHWGSENFREAYKKTTKNMYEPGRKLVLLDDSQYLKVEKGVYQIVSV